eukprot:m.452127 g.452127  ORF g.452127 m.452127 type:complete len:60 (-) comp20271_c0_seq1:250-429(-)
MIAPSRWSPPLKLSRAGFNSADRCSNPCYTRPTLKPQMQWTHGGIYHLTCTLRFLKVVE